MLFFRYFGLLASLLISLTAWSQTRAAATPRPALIVSGTTDAPIQLRSVEVRAEVSGRVAQTAVEMVFFNPNRRILEGELQFPLLDGQSVESFALDIDGKLREAVPVEKARGQAIFEDIIRARIDPALLEATQGNNFKLRVYPLPAGGTRRVVVRIAETLSQSRGQSSFRLPLDYGERVGSLKVEVVVHGKSAPAVVRGDASLLRFQRQGDIDFYRARAERTDFVASGQLQLALPAGNAPEVITQRFDGKTYFHANLPVPAQEAPRMRPAVLGLIWDSSGSGASRDHGREFALLDSYLRKLGDVEVRLVRIRDRADAGETHRVVNGNWAALRRALETTAYDGATNLASFEPQKDVGTWLLFSDGLVNFAERPFPAVAVPLFAINAAQKSNPLFLRHVAQRSGGRFIDLTVETPSAALPKLLAGTSRVTRIESDGATQLVMASPIPEGGRVEIAGILTEPATSLRITLEHPDKTTRTVTLPLRTADLDSTQAAGRWARLRVAQLDGEYDFNRAEIRRLGKQFRLVTRETSLIVLDRVEDYARHEIEPPAELRAVYDQLLRHAAQRRSGEQQSHLEQVVRRFAEKQAWWNREFPKDPPTVQPVQAGAAQGARVPARLTDQRVEVRTPEEAVAKREENRSRMDAQPSPPNLAPQSSLDTVPPPKAVMRPRPAAAASSVLPAEPAPSQFAIRLQKWQPNAPYMARLKQAAAADVYRIYLDEKPGYPDSTAFYLDASDVLLEKGRPDLAARVLSNLAEMNLENRHILRILGHRLLQAKAPEQAVIVFRQVLALSPEEPQSHRDLGLALAAAGQTQEAIDKLYDVVVRPWHGRFPEVELIALADMNALIATSAKPLDTRRMDARLLKNFPLDLRVILTWDADNTDIDLWVTDPNGERAFYGHRLTRQGGRMSLDFTGGYGPEEFSLKRAKPGKYRIEAQYYGDRRQNIAGPTTLQARLVTRFGTADAREQIVTLRLKDQRELVQVGEFEVE